MWVATCDCAGPRDQVGHHAVSKPLQSPDGRTQVEEGILSSKTAPERCPSQLRCSHVVIATFEPLCGKETVEVLGWQKHVFAVCG